MQLLSFPEKKKKKIEKESSTCAHRSIVHRAYLLSEILIDQFKISGQWKVTSESIYLGLSWYRFSLDQVFCGHTVILLTFRTLLPERCLHCLPTWNAFRFDPVLKHANPLWFNAFPWFMHQLWTVSLILNILGRCKYLVLNLMITERLHDGAWGR